MGSAVTAETYDEKTTEEGLRFSSNQTVEGFGITSSYVHINSSNRLLHSYSSGSGVFTSESKALIREGLIAKLNPGSFSANTGVGYLENASKAASPTRLIFPGSFHAGPINFLWSDCTILFAGGDNATSLKACFDQVQAINKEMTTTASGNGAYEDASSSTSFTGSMDLNAVFNGTGRIGAYVGPASWKINDISAESCYLIDNYYWGAYTIGSKMKIGYKATVKQEEAEWMPCCYGGLASMNYEEKKDFLLDTEHIFNCSCISEMK